MKPIQAVLPKNPWEESLRHPLHFSSYPSRLSLPIDVAKSICGMKPPIFLRIASAHEQPYQFVAGFVVHRTMHALNNPSNHNAAGL